MESGRDYSVDERTNHPALLQAKESTTKTTPCTGEASKGSEEAEESRGDHLVAKYAMHAAFPQTKEGTRTTSQTGSVSQNSKEGRESGRVHREKRIEGYGIFDMDLFCSKPNVLIKVFIHCIHKNTLESSLDLFSTAKWQDVCLR